MNHHETIELLRELARSGVTHFKTHDMDVSFDLKAPKVLPPTPARSSALADWVKEQEAPIPEPVANEAATEKLKDLIETLKMDDASLLDKIFPAGAGG
jgi:hypothetical protein